MKLRYPVSEENYVEMLEAQLKRKSRSLLSILLTLVCTVGQMGVLIYLIAIGQITGVHIYALGTMSILIFALNIVYRLTTHRRAVVALKRFKDDGKLSPEFWKEHDFRLENELTIRFGSLKSTYPLRDIDGYEELPSSYILYAGGTVADLIPYSAIGDKEEFLAAIRNAQHDKLRADAEENRTNIPETYKYAFEYTYTMENYIAQQKEGYRKMYTTKLMWKPINIVRLLLSIYALGYMFYRPTSLTIPICIFLFILLNLQHIVTFTPLSHLTIKQGLGNFFDNNQNSHVNVYITADQILIRGDMHSLDIPIKDFKAMRRINGGIALYLPKNAVLTIPNTDTADDGEFAQFVKFMDYKVN
ncbi:MAG: hypothetical protein AB7D36_00920 [Oscillospiraceae bacterium]